MVVRVYADGVFDLFHHGHARVLEQAKHAFADVHLVVGVHNDDVVHAMKGPTVTKYEERLEALRHCRWVDEIIGDAPWRIDEPFIQENKIDFVAHDEVSYPSDGVGGDLYEVPKRLGIFIATERTPDVSTSCLIQRILDNAELFLARNECRMHGN